MLDYGKEEQLHNLGYRFVCGVDEAGRGPLAGPVCAAAVILPPGLRLEGLDDSKKLTPAKRERLAEEIRREALAFAVAMADESVVDRLNILWATMQAMREAAESLRPAPDYVLVDGNRVPEGLPVPAEAVVGGDGICACIAAASVLAKTERDRHMQKLDESYPLYKFGKHKGYPTPEHIEILRKIGPCPAHRQSFLRKIL